MHCLGAAARQRGRQRPGHPAPGEPLDRSAALCTTRILHPRLQGTVLCSHRGQLRRQSESLSRPGTLQLLLLHRNSSDAQLPDRQIPAEDVLSVNFTEIGEPAHPNHLRGPLLRGWQPPEAHREDHQIKVTHNPYGGHLRSSVLVAPGASRR